MRIIVQNYAHFFCILHLFFGIFVRFRFWVFLPTYNTSQHIAIQYFTIKQCG